MSGSMEASVPQESKAVLINGASGGVGTAAVRRLVAKGWRVFAGVRTPDAAERTSIESDQVVPVRLDVRDQSSIDEAAHSVTRHLNGGLDGLVNCAGLSVRGPVEMVPLEALRRQFEVNVIGQIAVTQAFLPWRLAGGRVVNIGGAAGSVTLPMLGALSASKAALDSLTDALRMELKYQGVHVSIVEPGALQTDFFDKAAASSRRDGFAGGVEVQGIYAAAIDAADRAMSASPAAPVDSAVRAIVRALTDRRPAPRYIVGWDAILAIRLLRGLPDSVRDRLLMASLGLGRSSFGDPKNVAGGTQGGAL